LVGTFFRPVVSPSAKGSCRPPGGMQQKREGRVRTELALVIKGGTGVIVEYAVLAAAS